MRRKDSFEVSAGGPHSTASNRQVERVIEIMSSGRGRIGRQDEPSHTVRTEKSLGIAKEKDLSFREVHEPAAECSPTVWVKPRSEPDVEILPLPSNGINPDEVYSGPIEAARARVEEVFRAQE